MKNKVSLSMLMCVMVSLTHPAWSMENEENQKETHVTATLMGMPEKIQKHIFSFLTSPRDIGSLVHLNKKTNHVITKTYLDSPEEKISFLRNGVRQGDPEAQFMLGLFYAVGEGVPQSSWEACKYYTLAAVQGHASAQYYLAHIYKKGAVNFDQPEGDKAIYWFTKAAYQGHPEAQFGLAEAYIEELGNKEKKAEWEKAVPLFSACAHKGDSVAQLALGSCYYNENQGTSQDYSKACQWYGLAAKQGNVIAIDALDLIPKKLAIEDED